MAFRKSKVPDFSSKSSGGMSGMNTLLGYMLGQQKAQKGLEELGGGGVPISQTSKDTGTLRKTPIGAEFEAGSKLREESLKEQQKQGVNFGLVRQLFKGVIAQTKGAREEQGGLGLGPGLIGQTKAKLKRPGTGRIAAAFGQNLETALKQSGLLTGQNRIIKSLINQILKSIPGGLDPTDQVFGKVDQSFRNAFAIAEQVRASGFDLSKIANLTDEELDEIGLQGIVLDDLSLENLKLPDDAQQRFIELQEDLFNTPAVAAGKLPEEGEIFRSPLRDALGSDIFGGGTPKSGQQASPIPGSPKPKFSLGQRLTHGGKTFEVVGLDDPNDPDLREIV